MSNLSPEEEKILNAVRVFNEFVIGIKERNLSNINNEKFTPVFTIASDGTIYIDLDESIQFISIATEKIIDDFFKVNKWHLVDKNPLTFRFMG